MGWFAARILGAALFPRVAYWVRWPTRLGLRGRIAYAAFNALLLFAARQLVVHLREIMEEHERAREELQQQLGREPTERELYEHVGLSREA
jgi:hypothetical protein